ncbi:hypothetical protein [Tabrizicola sp.]|uniref:hypothetical protein n=1 Tax=Tabrizicola sp. TaxID=2005166 RepID=UPI003F418B24
MTHLAKLMMLATLGLGPTAALADGYSGTITGENGGTIVYSGDCDKAEVGVVCTREGVWTGPKGYTANRKVDSEATSTGGTKKITTTGQFGRTVTTIREWNR